MEKLFFNRQIKVLFASVCLLVLAMKMFGPSDSLDERLFYTGTEARFLIDSLEHSEARRYVVNEVADFVLIGLYSALFYLSLREHYPKWQSLQAFAFVPGLFDLVETAGVTYAIVSEGPHVYLNGLGSFTLLKWVSGTVVMIALFIGSVILQKPANEPS